MVTFGQVLERRLRTDPGQPLVTFYDDRTGERTELSVTTYANWVAKTAGVLVEDLDLAAGDRLRIELPTHWLGPVFLGAAWAAGIEVTHDPVADVLVEGPDGAGGGAAQVLRCALAPFAVASREPMPAGVLDFGTLWPGQPDAFLGVPAGPDDAAYDGMTQATLLQRPAASADRVLTDLVPGSPEGVALFLDTLVGGGSTIWVANPAPELWAGRASAERAIRTARAVG